MDIPNDKIVFNQFLNPTMIQCWGAYWQCHRSWGCSRTP